MRKQPDGFFDCSGTATANGTPASSATPSSPGGAPEFRCRANIKDYQMSMDGDLLRDNFSPRSLARTSIFTLAGHLGSKDVTPLSRLRKSN